MFDENRLSARSPHALAALRIVTALLLIEHGTQKLFGFPGAFPMDMNPLLWVAALLEVFGGLLVLVGFFTRPAAFILSGEMAVGYFMVHAPQGFYPLFNGGEPAVLFCFVFLFLVFAGPGAWSVDAMRSGANARAGA
ncbi:MAG: DoxX family protein [Propylenella sp.]